MLRTSSAILMNEGQGPCIAGAISAAGNTHVYGINPSVRHFQLTMSSYPMWEPGEISAFTFLLQPAFVG